MSRRICLSLNSFGSGRCWRCFSSEFRRSTGEMGVSSTAGLGSLSAILTGSNYESPVYGPDNQWKVIGSAVLLSKVYSINSLGPSTKAV